MPQSLRGRLVLLIVTLVAVPVLLVGYFLTIAAEQALLSEKEQKLFGAAAVLDKQLQGTYNDIIRERGLENAPREQQIAALNRELHAITDQVAHAYPGIGVGYYSKELDAILTYGPSETYAEKVGLAISQNHEGRLVMETGRPRVQEGELVRGLIMNAMHPVIRDGTVIGYIWANELTSDIQAQIGTMKRKIYFLIVFGLFVGMVGAAHVVDRLAADVNTIKNGLARIKNDFSCRLPAMAGEVGEIAAAINDMVKNLAEKKRLEEQVRRAEKLAVAGEVAAGLAHEIRNPLMAIKGFTQLLQEEAKTREAQEYTEIIIKETDRMNRLIEQLLCFSRSGDEDNNREKVNASAVLENTLMLMETKTRKHHIHILRSIDYQAPEVLANSEQLKQVLLNILINAIQAIGENGEIQVGVSYSKDSAEVLIHIADSGPGIEPEHVDKLFDPFFTTKEAGTGLGLAVAHRLISYWGGRIMVQSSLGKGSVFTVALPAVGGDGREQGLSS